MYSIYPTGTTIYRPDRTWNGYTVFHSFEGAVVIDMNGNVVHLWKGLNGSPNRMLPGGAMIGTIDQPVIAARFEEDAKPEVPDLGKEQMLVVNWDGKVIWSRHIPQHHDFQVEGNPVGYPAPDTKMQSPDHHKLLVLANRVAEVKEAPGKIFLDDVIQEFDGQGNEIFHWNALDHIDDMELSGEAKETIYRLAGDWCHLNAVSYIGPNHFYDEGVAWLNPENLLVSCRELSLLFIIDRKTGNIIWKKGPSEAEENFRQWRASGHRGVDDADPGLIIGQHHAHIIPKGLPGEGNLLLFDNGGFSGYGEESAGCLAGKSQLRRHYSRVLEINPVTWKIVWSYVASPIEVTAGRLFSPLLGSVQRLENGNTLVTEGVFGRVMEVTPEHEVVWEYINDLPAPFEIMGTRNLIYRAYRVPYDYLPFLEKPEEVELKAIDSFTFRVPGSVEKPMQEKDKVPLQF